MSVLLTPIEYAINSALKQDPETREKLDQFEQRQISVEVTDIQFKLHILFDALSVKLTTQQPAEADLTIRASSTSLLKLLQDPEQLFSADIEIIGDVQFAKQLQDVLDGFEFDWEQQIANHTGDLIAQPLSFAIKQSWSWLNESKQAMQIKLAEYLRDEAQLLPEKQQINVYLKDIDHLNADCDRIEARIQRLYNKQSLNQ